MTDPEMTCLCGHELKWHNACSRCACAVFIPATEKRASIRRAWRMARNQRALREGTDE